MGIFSLFKRKTPEFSIFPIGQIVPDGWPTFVRECLEGEMGATMIRFQYEPYDLPTRTTLPGLTFVAVRDLPAELRGAKPDDLLPLGHFQKAQLNDFWRWETVTPAVRVAFKVWLAEWTWVNSIHATMGTALTDLMHGHELLPPGCGPDAAPRVNGKLPVYALGLEVRDLTNTKEIVRQTFLDHALRVVTGSLSMVCPIGPDEGKPRLRVLFPSWIVTDQIADPDKPQPKIAWNSTFVQQRLRGYIDAKYLEQLHVSHEYEDGPLWSYLAARDATVIKSLHEFLGRAKRG